MGSFRRFGKMWRRSWWRGMSCVLWRSSCLQPSLASNRIASLPHLGLLSVLWVLFCGWFSSYNESSGSYIHSHGESAPIAPTFSWSQSPHIIHSSWYSSGWPIQHPVASDGWRGIATCNTPRDNILSTHCNNFNAHPLLLWVYSLH